MILRLSRLLALLLLAALALAACVPGGSPVPTVTLVLPAASGTRMPIPTSSSSPTPPPTATFTPLPVIGVDPAKLQGTNIQVWQAFSGPASGLFDSQVALFNTSNEWGIVVTSAGYADYTALFEAVNSALDSGQPPDMLAALPEQTLTWDARGAVVDLKPYLSDPQW